ncbi:MAG: ABC transporter substrate-binding protein [Elusimicrobia bacterium]|nr:ABC transporter substrate-binding protein [Elusimicrobiota bacterium]
MVRLSSIALACCVALCPRWAFAEKGVSTKEIRVGTCLPLSGVPKIVGQEELTGARAYIRHINDSGGVHGRKISIVAFDDEADTKKAVECFDKLVNEEDLFCGAFFSGGRTVGKYVPLAEKHEFPIVGVSAGIEQLYRPFNRYIFNARATYQEEISAEVAHVWDDLGLRRFAIIYQDDIMGSSGFDGIVKSLAARGASPAVTVSYPIGFTTDVTQPIATARAADPDVVFVVATFSKTAEIVKKAKSSGWTRPLYIILPGRELLSKLAGEMAENVVFAINFPHPDSIELPSVALFRELLKKYYPEATGSIKEEEAFFHAVLFVEALERTGKNPTREKLIKALESMRDVDLGFGPEFKVTFTPTNHQGFSNTQYMVIKGGKPVLFTDWKTLRWGEQPVKEEVQAPPKRKKRSKRLVKKAAATESRVIDSPKEP